MIQVTGGLAELACVIHRVPAVLAMCVFPVGHESLNVVLLSSTFITHELAFGCLDVAKVTLVSVPTAGCGSEELGAWPMASMLRQYVFPDFLSGGEVFSTCVTCDLRGLGLGWRLLCRP